MKKKLIIGIAIAVLIGGVYGYMQYNKPHLDIGKATVDYNLDAKDLLEDFQNDEAAAGEKYLDKVLLVNGEVKEISVQDEKTSIMLKTGDPLSSILCELEEPGDLEKISPGQQIKIKGVCSGMLMDVVLVRSIVIN